MPPIIEAAPAPTGASFETNHRQHDTGFPDCLLAVCRDETWREAQCLAALMVSAPARSTFRELGIGPEMFSTIPIQRAVAWALCERPTAPADVEKALLALATPAPLRDEIALYAAVLRSGPTDLWAVRDILRHAAVLAGRWIGPHIKWIVARLDAGEPVEPLVRELDKLLVIVRPSVLDPEGRS